MSFTDNFNNADPDAASTDGEPPADGTYDVTLIDARAFTSKNGHDVLTLKIRDNTGGHEWTVLQGFKSQAQANVTKKVVRALGASIDAVSSIDELDGRVKEKVGNYYTVEVKRSGQWTNTYFQENAAPVQPDIGGFEPAPAPATIATGGDDDVPF